MSVRLNSGPSGETLDSVDGPSGSSVSGVVSWDHECSETVTGFAVLVYSFASATEPTVTVGGVSATLRASNTGGSGFYCWAFSVTSSVPQGTVEIVVTQSGGDAYVTGHSYALRSAGALEFIDDASVIDSGTEVTMTFATGYRPGRIIFGGLSTADDPGDVDGAGSHDVTLDTEVDIGSSVLVMGYSEHVNQESNAPSIGVQTTGSETFTGVGIFLGEVLVTGDEVKLTANLPDSDAFTILLGVQFVNERPGTFRNLLALESDETYITDFDEFVGCGVMPDGQFVGFHGNFSSPTTGPPTDGTPFWVAITRSGTGSNNATYRWRLHSGGSWTTRQTSEDATFTAVVAHFLTDSWGEWCDARGQCARVWGAALSEGELDDEVESATAVRTSDLICDCPLTSNANDASGNGNHLTTSGVAWEANFLTFEGDPEPEPEPGDGGEAVSSGIHMTLWTDLPSEGGRLLGFIGAPYLVAGGRWRRRLTNDHELAFGVAWSAPWIADVRLGRVIRLAARGEVWWWVIRYTTDELQAPVKYVHAVGIEDRLRAMGPLKVSATGQRSYYSAGYIDLVPHQAIDTFILPHLHAAGWSGIGRGQIDSLKLHEQAWALQSAREVFDAMGVKVGCETRLRYDVESGDHLLEVLDEIGADAPPVMVASGRNLRSLNLTKGRGDFATALVPLGDGANGTGERHGISEASWYVSAKSGDVLTLAARTGGAGPVAFPGQWTGCWLLSRAATFVEVVGCDSETQEVEVDTGGGSAFAVGDEVVFFADDQGTPVTELTNPAAVDAYGRECLTKSYEGYRSERQHLLNPFFARWPNLPDVELVYLNGDANASDTSWDLDGGPNGRVISAGDILWQTRSAGTGTARLNRQFVVSTGDTLDGAGEGSVTVTSNTLGVLDNTPLFHFRRAGRLPERWEASGSVIVMSRPAAALNVSCQLDATYADPGSYVVALKGLEPDTEVAFGDHLGSGRMVARGGIADDSGNLTILADVPLIGAENDAITITRPGIEGSGARLPIILPPVATSAGYVASEDWTWRYRLGMLPQYFSLAMAIYTVASAGTITQAALEVRQSGGTLIDSVAHPGDTSDPLLLSVGADIEADTSLEARIVPRRSNQEAARLLTIPIRCYAFEAADEMTPPIDGSHGTELVQRGNLDLARLSVVPAAYQASYVDLSEAKLDGYAAAWERAVLGGRVMIRAETMGVGDMPRVVEMGGSLDDPRLIDVSLGTRPDLASRQFARSRPLPQFIGYQPEDSDGESVRTGSASMPAKVENSPRSVGSPGSAPSEVPVDPRPVALKVFSLTPWLQGVPLPDWFYE